MYQISSQSYELCRKYKEGGSIDLKASCDIFFSRRLLGLIVCIDLYPAYLR